MGDDGNSDITQSLEFAIEERPTHGILTAFDATTGRVTYTPNADYNGPDRFSFTVTDDGQFGGTPLTSPPTYVDLVITPVNDPPVPDPQSISTPEEMSVAITLTGSDEDPEVVQPLIFAIARGPENGTLSELDVLTGEVVYTPNPDYEYRGDFIDEYRTRQVECAVAAGEYLSAGVVHNMGECCPR